MRTVAAQLNKSKATTEQELPTGSSVKISQLCLSCSQNLCSAGQRAVLVMHVMWLCHIQWLSSQDHYTTP